MIRNTPAVSAAVLLALVAALLAVPAGARAAGTVTATVAPDYATEHFADPWDYASASDVLLDEQPTQLARAGRPVRRITVDHDVVRPLERCHHALPGERVDHRDPGHERHPAPGLGRRPRSHHH